MSQFRVNISYVQEPARTKLSWLVRPILGALTAAKSEGNERRENSKVEVIKDRTEFGGREGDRRVVVQGRLLKP